MMSSILWSEKSWAISFIILFSAICRKAFGYPEIHFVLARGLSFITRRRPEIVFDVPWRIRKGQPLPIACIINDAHKYPVELLNVKVQVFGENLLSQTILSPKSAEELISPSLAMWKATRLKTRYWYMLEYIQLPEDFTGPLYIAPQAEIILRGKHRTVTVDNLPGLSQAPLRTYVSDDALPTFDGWYYGDPHFHSDKTADQVEFSAPVEVAAIFAKAIGLNWFAVTDHSYDLDAPLDDDFAIDPNLPRWENLKAEVRDVNSLFDDLVVLLGEEVSCGNSKGQNVHLLIYGTPEFIPGRGDAGKTGFAFEFHPDLSIEEVLDKVRDYDGVAYAAHPDADNSFLGKLILNRGTWLDEDCELPGCSGLQFWNGCSGKRYTKGYKRWMRLLLEGYKRYTIAGSDAHGDFNRIRKMIFPFVKLGESTKSSFALPRTAIYCGATLNEKKILDALRNGRAALTNGPLAIFSVKNDSGQIASIGETIPGKRFELKIQAKSTEEFGELRSLKLYRGNLSRKEENIEAEIPLKGYVYSSTHSITANEGDCYLRLEVTSRQNQQEYRCITNPIWLMNFERDE